jgi:hypothetical protein
VRKLQDPDNDSLKGVLEQLLTENVDVTVREVARRHPELKNASAFTRNRARMALINESIERQFEVRSIAARLSTQDAACDDNAQPQTVQIEALQERIKLLVAAHAGLIRAVQLAGGMSALERFWTEYKAVSDTVHGLGAVPQAAVVVPVAHGPQGSSRSTRRSP